MKMRSKQRKEENHRRRVKNFPQNRRPRPLSSRATTKPQSNFRFTDKAPRYGKCRKNQAASIGTTAYDGCGEFVTTNSGENCTACGCNRSFHREEEESILDKCIRSETIDESVLEAFKISWIRFRQIFCSPYGNRRRRSNGEEELAEEEEKERVIKRLKTKFTAEQTEKMRSYAEKLRWKMSPENREVVDGFCVEIGVNRKNFRIWMNNH